MLITKCTITGADDGTSIHDMRALQMNYPFAEWGILVGGEGGHPRWPSNDWLLMISRMSNILPVTLHLCGQPLRRLLVGELHDRLLPFAIDSGRWDAIQLNTHGTPHEFNPAGKALLDELDIVPIVQVDNVNTAILETCKQGLENGDEFRAIFDLSHGAGILPTVWPQPFRDVLCTYAGGLGPENLREQLEKINHELSGDSDEVPYTQEIAIDMETRVRTDDDKFLDLKKVEACFKIVEQWNKEMSAAEDDREEAAF